MAVTMTADEVAEALGDKIIENLASIVVGAKSDLAAYRRALPSVVSRSTNRGLANWIHDAMRSRAIDLFDDWPGVVIRDIEPHFEIQVTLDERTAFRIRFKRHSRTGRISAYPTQGMLEFLSQPEEEDLFQAFGYRLVHLCVGYEWEPLTRSMGGPVMTMRDGSFDEVDWMVDLPTAPAAGSDTVITPIMPDSDAPSAPKIDVGGKDVTQVDEESTEG